MTISWQLLDFTLHYFTLHFIYDDLRKASTKLEIPYQCCCLNKCGNADSWVISWSLKHPCGANVTMWMLHLMASILRVWWKKYQIFNTSKYPDTWEKSPPWAEEIQLGESNVWTWSMAPGPLGCKFCFLDFLHPKCCSQAFPLKDPFALPFSREYHDLSYIVWKQEVCYKHGCSEKNPCFFEHL